jgi:hypothetical protein
LIFASLASFWSEVTLMRISTVLPQGDDDYALIAAISG